MSESWNRRPGRTSSWITRKRRLAIYERDGGACVYCSAAARPLTLDHLKPRALGGSHASTNLVTACCVCNSARKHLPVAVFCRVVALQTGEASAAVAARVRRQRHRRV